MRYRLVLNAVAVLTLAGPWAASAAAKPAQVQKAMQGLRWGQKMSDVVGDLLKRVETEMEAAIADEPNWEVKSQVRKAYQERMRSLRSSYTRFTGSPTPHDSVLEGHFAHGNDESVLVDAHASAKDYYFFHKDTLWKWVRIYEPKAFQGKNFADFGKAMQQRFGRGRSKSGVPEEGGSARRWLEWSERTTRLRALEGGGQRGYSLVFESPKGAQQLAKLRSTQQRSKASAEPESAVARSRFANRRSVIKSQPSQRSAEELRQEQARRNEARRSSHERRQQQKKNQVLNSLDKVDEADPIGGIGL